MARRFSYPTIVYTEEVMREGMQIESVDIPTEAKIRLLDKLSETGLQNIVVGSFVSPKYTPQMARVEEVVAGFTPVDGVRYTAMIPNAKGLERAQQYAPPLSIGRGRGLPTLRVHQCDVFVRRNYNRSQMKEMSGWVQTVADAKAKGATEAGISTNATFGSNFLGDFPVEAAIRILQRQHDMWDAAGIKVTSLSIGDPMGWCHPEKVERILGHAKDVWPEIDDFRVHLHNSRGMALTSAYAAIRSLEAGDTLHMEGTLGGVGGCPYCGNGRATGMMATEDFMHMLQGMGIETGVDLDKLVGCVWLLEEMLGRQVWGHVSRAGPRPETPEALYPPGIPFVETLEQAEHFKRGPQAYEGGIVPWDKPIDSPYLARVKAGQPAFGADGNWPWTEDFFPGPDDVRAALGTQQKAEVE